MGVDEAVEAIRSGRLAVLATDTVYGLCADGYRAGPVERLRLLKGTPQQQPISLLAAELEVIFEGVPELRGRSAGMAGAILPGPYTLVLPNPARRFSWLAGGDPTKIGIRVPHLPDETRAVLDGVGAVAATSANLHGGDDPATLGEVPEEIRAAVGALIDAGALPGTPSTVVDLTGAQPRVLREGAVSAAAALDTIARVANE
jgi:L-threonylcarbamoyladenylate synthase